MQQPFGEVEPDPYGLFSRPSAPVVPPDAPSDLFPAAPADPFPAPPADPVPDDPFGLAGPFPPAPRGRRSGSRTASRPARASRGRTAGRSRTATTPRLAPGRAVALGVTLCLVAGGAVVGVRSLGGRSEATVARTGSAPASGAAAVGPAASAGDGPATRSARPGTATSAAGPAPATADAATTSGTGTSVTAAGAVRYDRVSHADWRAVTLNPNAYAGWTLVVHGFATEPGGGSTVTADVDAVPHSQRAKFTTPAVLGGSEALLAQLHDGDGFQAWVQIVGTRTATRGGRATLVPVLQVNRLVVTVPAKGRRRTATAAT